MGDYDLVFVTKDEKGEDRTIWTDQSIRVDEYRLPTMKAESTGPKTPPVRTTSVPLSLFAGYPSGGTAHGLPVELRTHFRPSRSPPQVYEGWNRSDEARVWDRGGGQCNYRSVRETQ